MDKSKVAEILEEIGTLLELKGENPFKCRAYHNASRVIEGTTEDLKTLIAEKRLAELKGIGEGLSEKIIELVQTGKLKYYDELKRSLPKGLVEMLAISGLGPKKVQKLYKDLGIKSVGELEVACHENRLSKLDGFGEKSQENILKGIAFLKKSSERRLISQAAFEAEGILKSLKRFSAGGECFIAGSLRRKRETIKDIDIVASSKNPSKMMRAFAALPSVERSLQQGETKSAVILKSGIQVDLRIVSPVEFPFALLHFTGSAEHNTTMRARAQKRGLKLNEYGLFRGARKIMCKSEEEIFKALGLVYIPPEMREDSGEIEAAEKGRIPMLIEEKDIPGFFHCHTTYSDGTASVLAMVKRAQELGYAYIGISDHSKTASYAHGMKEPDVARQHKEIDAVQKRLRIRIFRGVESDILPDGNLDYSEKFLNSFDFVIASVHSKFNMTEADMTRRVLKAVSNPHTTILGHPTGRLLLEREGYAVAIEKVLEACAKYDVAIELNANPHRLDLDWRHLRRAKTLGVKVCINPDAHRLEGLSDVAYGVAIARKGWLEKKDVLNTLTLPAMEKFLCR